MLRGEDPVEFPLPSLLNVSVGLGSRLRFHLGALKNARELLENKPARIVVSVCAVQTTRKKLPSFFLSQHQ